MNGNMGYELTNYHYLLFVVCINKVSLYFHLSSEVQLQFLLCFLQLFSSVKVNWSCVTMC